ncbi:hypothetical protein PAPHI01_2189 [Pancytospora philotis]|nr:hypothetical protein PAPHI01_2189 [Pancytospora philotis]
MRLAEADVAYEGYGYAVDADKNLYRLEDGEHVLVERLRKAVYRMAVDEHTGEDAGAVYMLDSFGDCYRLGADGKPRFIAGILGMPGFFEVARGKIYILDGYGRLWVLDTAGRVVSIVFVGESCRDVAVRGGYVAFVTGGAAQVAKGAPAEGQCCRLKVYNGAYSLVHTADDARDVQFLEDGVQYTAGARRVKYVLDGGAVVDQ